MPLNAVVADFMAGAIEWLTPDNDAGHWDLIEGQGSLFHPSYSGVTLALVHVGEPDAHRLCHEPTRAHMRGLPDYPLPLLEALRDLSLAWRGSSIRTSPVGAVDQHRRFEGSGRARVSGGGRDAAPAAGGRPVPAGGRAAGGRPGVMVRHRDEVVYARGEGSGKDWR